MARGVGDGARAAHRHGLPTAMGCPALSLSPQLAHQRPLPLSSNPSFSPSSRYCFDPAAA